MLTLPGGWHRPVEVVHVVSEAGHPASDIRPRQQRGQPPWVLGEVRHEFQKLIPRQGFGEGEGLLRSELVVVVERLGCLQLLLCLFYFRLFILLGYIFDNERQTIDSQTSIHLPRNPVAFSQCVESAWNKSSFAMAG